MDDCTIIFNHRFNLCSMEKQWLYQPYILIAIVLLFFVQQIIMTHDSRARTIDPYATTTKTLTDSSYYNHKLAKN